MKQQWDAVRSVLQARRADPPLRAGAGGTRASLVQERLWSLPDRATRGSAVRCRLRGPLDVDALRRAVAALGRRHEVLRATFAMDGQLVSRLGGDLVLDDAPRSDMFDLERGPLFRASLARIGPDEHELVLAAHDAVFDSWSFEIVMRDLAALYAGTDLPALPLRYADFASWQRARVPRLDLGHLRGARPVGQFATGHPAGREVRAVSRATTTALHELARREGVTLFMVLLAAFARALGDSDVVVGCPVANRTHADLEHLVGPFANALVLRLPKQARLERVRDVVVSGLAQQDVPFEHVVDALGLGGDLPIWFAMQNVPRSGWAWPGLAAEATSLPPRHAARDVTLTMQDSAEGLVALLDHDAVNIGAARATRLVERLVAELDALVGPAARPALRRSPPSDDLERTLLGAYERVLGTTGLGATDNFFARGGDSLAAVKLGVEIERLLGVEVPLVLLFEQPTVAGLADALRGRDRASADPCVVPIKYGTRPRPLFLGAGGRSGRDELMLYAKLLAHSRSEDQVYGLLARPRLDSIEAIAADHIASMRAIQPRGPYRVGGECVGGLVAYEIAQQLRAAGDDVELLLLIDTWCPSTRGSIYNALTLPWTQLEAGVKFFAGLRGRPDSAEPWPRELWRRAITPLDARRYIRACHRYRPASYAAPITLLMSEENLRRGWASPWELLADGGLTLHRTPGGRKSYAKQYLDATAMQLRRCLEGVH